MYTKIWVPDTDAELDGLFEQLRVQQHSDTTHPLHKNYAAEAFKECSALSITFDNDQPVVVSSILARSCWPKNTYRILNRFWKVHEHRLTALDRSAKATELSETVKAHVDYAENILKADLVFMSRQYNHWQNLASDYLKKKTGIEFNYNDHRYLVCDNPQDQTCWQKITYKGDQQLLTQWQKQ
jgi:hypothetical protein